MTTRLMRSSQLKAVRMIRAGSPADAVCAALRLRLESVRAWENACRDTPDDILAQLEHVLEDNEKLRRLVAALGHMQPAQRSGNVSG